ncbi:MAG TPA: cold shock domain-containing protein [Bryobacteraceae bacterium]|nr:cold shock domain-containing protein [Bryobacteraceae bacterium]
MTLLPQITFRNMEPVANLEASILKEISVLERFFQRIMSCRVMIEGPRGRRYGGLYKVRIDVGVPNEELVVENSPSLHGTLKDVEAPTKTKQSEPNRIHRDVCRAIHDAFQEMRRCLQDYVRRMRGQTKQHDVKMQAKIIKLFPEMDYGFLETPEGREVYFHRDSVLDTHFDRLRIGSAVSFAEETGDKGPQATTVKLVHPTKQARSAAKSKVVKTSKPPRRKRARESAAMGRR